MEFFLEDLAAIEKKLGYVFKDRSLCLLAFTHRSFVNENRDRSTEHNERLEFLGDAVLGMIVSNFLYRRFPQAHEGALSDFRVRLIDSSACIHYMQKLDVSEHILTGKGEIKADQPLQNSILSDVFEALIGAIYLDRGLQEVDVFFLQHFGPYLEEFLRRPIRNWKAELQDIVQKKHHLQPCYEVIAEEGPEHAKVFQVIVKIEERQIGRGRGSTKKLAQQDAACDALSRGEII